MPLKKLDITFWKRVKELAKENMKSATYDYFIEPAKLAEVNGNKALILVDSSFHKDYWRRQASDLIKTASLETYSDILEYDLLAPGDNQYIEVQDKQAEYEVQTGTRKKQLFPTGLQKKYTFDNFVEGANNKMPAAAAGAITDKPGDMYNPLFIFGTPGIGKTHLLHAIGNEFLRKRPQAAVRYASSETFVSDYVNASRKHQMEDFMDFYRNLDLLLLDDVQFFIGKEGTLLEFFSTFNALYDKGGQIVITSDREPRELDNLDERLTSRFSWGLTTQIEAPDYENRLGILLNKVEKSSIKFPEDTLRYIAGQISTNVRELEGALNQIEFMVKSLNLTSVDIETAEKALAASHADHTAKKLSSLTIKKIQDQVAKYYMINISDLTGPKRIKEIALARQVAMYLVRELMGTSLPTIGKEFGGRDHTTVIYAVKQISDKMKNDIETQKDIDNIKRKLE